MTQRKRKPKWSLLLIRDADHRVKQFRVSGKTFVFLPAAAALTVASCFAVLELKVMHRIHDLEARLVADSIQMENTVNSKEGEIASLQQELSRLNGQTENLRSQMDGLNKLEQKLQLFIGKYGEGLSDPSAEGSLPTSSKVAASVLTVPYEEPRRLTTSNDSLSIAALETTITDFSELSQMLDELAITMESSLRKSEQKRAEMDALPSGWPTVSRKLTSGFGYRHDPFTGRSTFHAGVDISGDVGDPIYSAGEGKVKEVGFDRTRGNYIIITHRNGLESWYMHLSEIGVKTDERVKRGERIGEMGNSGRSTGPHLHFQVVLSEGPVNPLRYLRLVKED
jgi:murein DD-endopeptidase MepM/ murein hydrolase activator NlpD